MSRPDAIRPSRTDALDQTLTGQVVTRAREIDHLPPHIIAAAQHCILDLLGVSIAGAREPVTAIIRAEALSEGGLPQSVLWGTGEMVSKAQAARVNGTAAHALDFDDVVSRMDGHPSAPVLPALAAVAAGADLTGRDFLSAFVAGFETEALIGQLMKPSHYARGFHATATVGTFGAAAAVCHAQRLGKEQWANAFGIAGSRASGLKSMFGTMAKPLQVGAAAENGLRAAALAARGTTAQTDVLGARQGFRDTQSDGNGTSESWYWTEPAITEVLFKHHAACYLTHSAIEGALSLRKFVGQPNRIDSVEVSVPAGHLSVCNIAHPSTPLEGKFSLRFTTAKAFVAGDLSESAFSQASLEDSQVAAILNRVNVRARTDSAVRSSTVRVVLTDGSEKTAEVDVNRPTPPDRLGQRWQSLTTKFFSLVEPVMGSAGAQQIVDEVAALPVATTIHPLLSALSPAPRANVEGGRVTKTLAEPNGAEQ